MKQRIIERLRKTHETVSGEVLSRELGISRVAVWKHIRALKRSGCPVESGPCGYRLNREADMIVPLEFEGRADRIHYFPSLSSTMDTAKEMARAGAPHGLAVVADRQETGRGRLGRPWLSDAGGLYFTVILRPVLPAALAGRMGFAAGAGLAAVLKQLYGLCAGLKWPNDVVIDDAKLAGMLIDMESSGDLVSFINIGIGVNVNNDPRPEGRKAVSLQSLLGKTVLRKPLLAGFLDNMEASILADPFLTRAIADWKTVNTTIGRHVVVKTIQDEIAGTAVDVDEDGSLLIRRASGEIVRVVYGDLFFG